MIFHYTFPEIPPSDNHFKGRNNVWQYRKEKRRRDPDNYSGKFLLDGLVRAGVLQDDSFSHIDLRLMGSLDRDNPRTEVLVEEEEGGTHR